MDTYELQNLLGEYWDCAYAEGKEGRDHDTADGRAVKALEAILSLFAAHRAAALEEAAKVCEAQMLGTNAHEQFDSEIRRCAEAIRSLKEKQ
jgi:hypothetical protein